MKNSLTPTINIKEQPVLFRNRKKGKGPSGFRELVTGHMLLPEDVLKTRFPIGPYDNWRVWLAPDGTVVMVGAVIDGQIRVSVLRTLNGRLRRTRLDYDGPDAKVLWPLGRKTIQINSCRLRKVSRIKGRFWDRTGRWDPAAVMGKVPRVLIIVAHDDDAFEFCGGLIIELVKNGVLVDICVVTDGSAGGPQADLVQQRLRDAKKAAAVVGASNLWWLGVPDLKVVSKAELHDALTNVIRASGASLVITHNPRDTYHNDHEIVAKAVTRARIATGAYQFFGETPVPVGLTPALAYFIRQDAMGKAPEYRVKFSKETMLKKRHALRCFVSQATLMDQRNMEQVATAPNFPFAIQRGGDAQYAEGFFLCGSSPGSDDAFWLLAALLGPTQLPPYVQPRIADDLKAHFPQQTPQQTPKRKSPKNKRPE
jgi:LmbE family N-acetylglucosaminyl deacetylase